MSGVSERISDLGYAIGWRLVRALPEKVAVALFDRGADFAVRNGGPEQLRRNLARVLGVPAAEVPDTLMQASMRSYARYWREAFRLPSMDLVKTGAALDELIEGQKHLDAAKEVGRGAILALPHSGNWDMAGVWCAQHWGGLSTVAERLKPESLYQRFVDYREGLGFEIFPLSGGEHPPFVELSARLRDNGIVCLLGERDLAKKGVPVTFFGEQTRMPAGPAKLAIDTGAPLLPVHCWFTDGGWGFRIDPPIDTTAGVAAATQALADRFEANIAAHPEDWHMLQPLWLSDLSQARLSRMENS
ncbi:phosphatidylinositol mannoside acyltransferase [Rhodococcus opacus]|uniref:phosphatidylinositol mannoside acyltransferase n=1 Tax=Rhodococcus TaxID=1827 RepID=UPI0006BB486B|nr:MULTISPECIES: phosphatidylinositol mannoside acyltransferase [Rhodococcus]MDI9940914.1 phosphatidylinositol mannoside acyltransferase [Rhodococcus sp. IEGM 1351]MDJ0420193.1 phosphatidylinositol mannoside acyltransferase [Rhodococcus opacus]MDV6247125.1 phosphatidylinositol mannoside acyltransferase [Rhodococcus opacus]QZS55938.1 phosphatidylinositol mannoside acyltransferase [Rhodococcus opacus]RKM70999.1 phosphatidylinositol mannoside acyltransferase [Rhodococcus opacus]